MSGDILARRAWKLLLSPVPVTSAVDSKTILSPSSLNEGLRLIDCAVVSVKRRNNGSADEPACGPVEVDSPFRGETRAILMTKRTGSVR